MTRPHCSWLAHNDYYPSRTETLKWREQTYMMVLRLQLLKATFTMFWRLTLTPEILSQHFWCKECDPEGTVKNKKNTRIKYLVNIVTNTRGSENEAQILTWGADMQEIDQSDEWDGEQNLHGVSTGFWLVCAVFGVFGAALCWSPDLCSVLYPWTLLSLLFLNFTEAACRVMQLQNSSSVEGLSRNLTGVADSNDYY